MTDSTITEQYYRQSHQEICTLVTSEDEHLPVPACPDWTLHDLLAHLTGAMQDFINRNTDGAPGPDWTAAHVARFRDTDLASIKLAWQEAIDNAGAVFRHLGGRLLPDVATHELDVRGALGNTEARDTDRLRTATEMLISWGDAHYRNVSMPAIELRFDGKSYAIGEGDPQAVISTSLFEASRVLTGRRSEAQIRALDWSVDPSPWIDHMSLLGRRDTDLVE